MGGPREPRCRYAQSPVVSVDEPRRAQPLVSVVIPTHLSPPPFLEEAVASVIAQTWTRWELVVVDDGSPDPDAVPALLRGVDPRVRFVRAERGGPARARNLGAAHTHGPLITFLDHDDAWFPEHLSRAVAALDADASAVAAFSAMEIVNATDHYRRVVDGRGVDRHTVLSGGARPSLNAFLIRRRVFDEVGGFDPRYDGAEDLDLVYKLVEKGPFVRVDEVAAIYRMHGENYSGDTRRTARSHDDMLHDHLRRARRTGDAEAVRDLHKARRDMRRYKAGRAVEEAVGAWRAARYRHALGLCWWAVRFSPVGVTTEVEGLVVRTRSRSRQET